MLQKINIGGISIQYEESKKENKKENKCFDSNRSSSPIGDFYRIINIDFRQLNSGSIIRDIGENRYSLWLSGLHFLTIIRKEESEKIKQISIINMEEDVRNIKFYCVLCGVKKKYCLQKEYFENFISEMIKALIRLEVIKNN